MHELFSQYGKQYQTLTYPSSDIYCVEVFSVSGRDSCKHFIDLNTCSHFRIYWAHERAIEKEFDLRHIRCSNDL